MSTKQLRSFAYNCVITHATFDGEQYTLSVNDLPDFIQTEFASLIMSSDDDRAHESISSDNELCNKKMLPALIQFLKNSTEQDEIIEFINTWKEGVTSYHKNYMQELIDDALQNYNSDNDYIVKDWNHYYGVSHLFGA